MARIPNNAEEIACRIQAEEGLREIVSAMATVARSLKHEEAYAAMVGLLAGIVEDEMDDARNTADVESLPEDFSADGLSEACFELTAAFAEVVRKRVGSRAM